MENEGPFGALGTYWERVRVRCCETWPSREGRGMETEDWRYVKLKRPNTGSLMRSERSPLWVLFAKRFQ